MPVSDSELMLGKLAAEGYAAVDNPDGADVILVNTCAIRDHAEQRVIGRLGELKRNMKPGAIVGMALFARAHGQPMLTVADLSAVVAPIGIFLGRVANFIKPEMWGRETDVPWAMVFPAAGDAPRHPSQLYEAGLEGAALGLVLWFAVRAGALKRPGLAAGLFGVGYGLARIFCEFFREPDPVQEALANGAPVAPFDLIDVPNAEFVDRFVH